MQETVGRVRIDSSSDHRHWARHDCVGKFLDFISGRATFLDHGEANPDFKFVIENVEHYDFVPEPNGGALIADHLFDYQMHVFRAKQVFLDGERQGPGIEAY